MIYTILSTVLALGYAASAVGVLANVRFYADAMAKVRVGKRLATIIAVLELAAVAGLVAGIFVPVLGAAAAIGLVALMSGAAVFHIRAKDFAGLPTVTILGLLSALTAVLAVRAA
jgi:DoxX-like protein